MLSTTPQAVTKGPIRPLFRKRLSDIILGFHGSTRIRSAAYADPADTTVPFPIGLRFHLGALNPDPRTLNPFVAWLTAT